MKSNFHKRSKANAENDKVKKNIYLDGLSTSERNKVFSEVIKESYDRLLNDNGEEKILPILEYMSSDDFVFKIIDGKSQKNKVLVKEFKTSAQYNVKKILYDYVESGIVGEINQGIKLGKTKKEIIHNMQNSEEYKKLLERENNSNDFFRAVIDQIKKSLENHIKIIEEKEEARKKNEKIKRDTEEIETIKAKEKNGKNKKIKNKKEQQIKAEENKKFIEAVARYTDNYKFLVQSREIYFAEKGRRDANINKIKFDNVDQYFRFKEIQEKLQDIIKTEKIDENEAIDYLLKSKVSGPERKILLERKNIILKVKKSDLEEPEI